MAFAYRYVVASVDCGSIANTTADRRDVFSDAARGRKQKTSKEEGPMKARNLLLMVIMTIVPAWAQQQNPGPDPIAETLFPPELVMLHQKAINLDDAQKNYIRAEISKAQSRFTELQWQMQDAMESLVAIIGKDTPEEQLVLSQLDKVLNVEREIKKVQITLMVRIKNKLTPEQQEKLRHLRKPS